MPKRLIVSLGCAFAAVLTVGPALAEGDAGRGERVFVRCRACHVVDEEQNRIGPHLVGLFGRRAGTVEGFPYSDAMSGSGIIWSEPTLDAFLADPRGYIPGNKMAFPALADEQDRADLIAYLDEAAGTSAPPPAVLLAVGLGEAGQGRVALVDPAADYAHLGSVRVPWPAYNRAGGETRPAWCDLDGDGDHELVLGLGPGGRGRIEVRGDEAAGFAHLGWVAAGWPAYNRANGETWPACGDLDGDGRYELVIGFGAGGQGRVRVRDDALAGYAHLGWVRLDWPAYVRGHGETRPAVGDLDDDGLAEIAVGLGPGGEGRARLFDDADAGFAPLEVAAAGGEGWLRLGWRAYDLANGETWPAVCDLDGDGRGEVVLGAGTGGRGRFRIFDGEVGFAPAAGTPQPSGWGTLRWPAYNRSIGAVFPACGDVDGDGADELALGVAPGGGSRMEVLEDLGLGLAPLARVRLPWADYNRADGLTRPALPR